MKSITTIWPKAATYWTVGRVLCVSIPFTWELRRVRERILQRGLYWDRVLVGGPAVKLVPKYFTDLDFVKEGGHYLGALQKVNPMATKTTIGCIRRCGFCAVDKIEPKFKELKAWPNLPVLIDNNLFAATVEHFDAVIDRLKKWGWADFNQGLDSRLLSDHHAARLAEIKKPMIRLALDNIAYSGEWEIAFEKLIRSGIAKTNIRSYALIGFDSDPGEAWRRCEFIQSKKIRALPAWFHELDAMKKNEITEKQKSLGWNDYERRRILQWFYKHKRAVHSK